MARYCTFCGSGAEINGEHIWSDWIGKVLAMEVYRLRRNLPDGTVVRWQKRTLSEKTKLVCSPCNSGWMSQLEERTKPIMTGMIQSLTPVKLGAPEIATIAAFGFKNAAIGDYMQSHRAPFLTTSDCRRFRESLELPGGVQIWLAALPKKTIGVFGNYYLKARKTVRNSFEGYIFNYGIGHFLLQATFWRWRSNYQHRHFLPPAVRENDRWIGYSAPLWPTVASVTWPPVSHLPVHLVDKFLYRWFKKARAVFE